MRSRAVECFHRHAIPDTHTSAIRPKAPCRGDQPQSEFRSAHRVVAPSVRRYEILSLAIEPRQPRPLLRAHELSLRLFRECQIESEMPRAGLVLIAGFPQPLLSILAYCLKHRITFAVSLQRHQRFFDKV